MHETQMRLQKENAIPAPQVYCRAIDVIRRSLRNENCRMIRAIALLITFFKAIQSIAWSTDKR